MADKLLRNVFNERELENAAVKVDKKLLKMNTIMD
jgi:hypothetical protein